MKIKLALVIVLTFLSIVLVYPQSSNLVGESRIVQGKVVFPVISPDFKSLLESSGLPQLIKFNSYNLKVSNQNEFDLSFYLNFSEGDKILPYLVKAIGPLIPTVDRHPGFEIRRGKIYEVRDIPIEVPFLNKYGIYALCGFDSHLSVCPASLQEWKNIKPIIIQANPNINWLTLFIQTIFTFSFWVVFINNLFQFFGTKQQL